MPLETATACAQSEALATAFSSSAILGPPMHTCESRTSLTAAITSALMVAYCACRSSSETFMVVRLLWRDGLVPACRYCELVSDIAFRWFP